MSGCLSDAGVNCSRFLNPRPQNSYHRAKDLFLEQRFHWHEQSEAAGTRRPQSADSRRTAYSEIFYVNYVNYYYRNRAQGTQIDSK